MTDTPVETLASPATPTHPVKLYDYTTSLPALLSRLLFVAASHAAPPQNHIYPGILLDFEINAYIESSNARLNEMRLHVGRLCLAVSAYNPDSPAFHLNFLHLTDPQGRWQDVPAEGWRFGIYAYAGHDDSLKNTVKRHLEAEAKRTETMVKAIAIPSNGCKPEDWADCAIHMMLQAPVDDFITPVMVHQVTTATWPDGKRKSYRHEIHPLK